MISIIIPTFNNEDTIERAIRSVIYQNYVDWELIIVNDASTDKTSTICEYYSNLYPNITIITNDKNKGVGISRKVGMKYAKGDFITFLDSDDLIMADFLDISVKLQQQHDSDVVYTSYTILYPQGINQVIPSGDYIMEGEATPQLHFVQEKKFLTGKLFRKSLLDKIPWSENRVGEDVQTLFYATYIADKVRSSSYSGYVHCFRQGSLLADAPQFFCYCWSTLAGLEMIDFLIDRDDTRLWKHELKNVYLAHQLILKLIEEKKIDKKERKKNKKQFQQIEKWFKNHQEYINQIEFEHEEN